MRHPGTTTADRFRGSPAASVTRSPSSGALRIWRRSSTASGEQYATPEAVELLRQVRKAPLDGERVTLAAGDPLNLSAVVVPGCRIPALSGRTTTWCDGLPITPTGGPGAAGPPDANANASADADADRRSPIGDGSGG